MDRRLITEWLNGIAKHLVRRGLKYRKQPYEERRRRKLMNFIKCPSCHQPLSLNGEEQIIQCPNCGTQINAGMAKLLYAVETKNEIFESNCVFKRRQK